MTMTDEIVSQILDADPGTDSSRQALSVDDALILSKLYSRLGELKAKRTAAEFHCRLFRLQLGTLNALSGALIFVSMMLLIMNLDMDAIRKVVLTIGAACVPCTVFYALMPKENYGRAYLRLLDDEIELTRAQISILVSKYGDDARRWSP